MSKNIIKEMHLRINNYRRKEISIVVLSYELENIFKIFLNIKKVPIRITQEIEE